MYKLKCDFPDIFTFLEAKACHESHAIRASHESHAIRAIYSSILTFFSFKVICIEQSFQFCPFLSPEGSSILS